LDVQKSATTHDASVTSHSIDQGAARHVRKVLKGELDMGLTEEWIGDLLENEGEHIYRMKGVLAIAHSSQRFVFHAVHMVMEGSFAEPWAEGEPRESKLVFIGKELDSDALNASFNACLATPENMQRKIEQLRFGVGDKVECKTDEDTWSPGVVVQLMFREDGMHPGLVAPYQIKLDDGELIYAQADSDCLIRQVKRRSGRRRQQDAEADELSAETDSLAPASKRSKRGNKHGHGHKHDHTHAH
jgi:hypothetical protein